MLCSHNDLNKNGIFLDFLPSHFSPILFRYLFFFSLVVKPSFTWPTRIISKWAQKKQTEYFQTFEPGDFSPFFLMSPSTQCFTIPPKITLKQRLRNKKRNIISSERKKLHMWITRFLFLLIKSNGSPIKTVAEIKFITFNTFRQ